jgi:hypothetical protein
MSAQTGSYGGVCLRSGFTTGSEWVLSLTSSFFGLKTILHHLVKKTKQIYFYVL